MNMVLGKTEADEQNFKQCLYAIMANMNAKTGQYGGVY